MCQMERNFRGLSFNQQYLRDIIWPNLKKVTEKKSDDCLKTGMGGGNYPIYIDVDEAVLDITVLVRIETIRRKKLEEFQNGRRIGAKNMTPASAYKSSKYFSYNQWSYYDAEIEMAKFRLPQPDPRVPDKPRDTTKNTENKA
uniref:NADH dehydrogenase [ubiquinone] flavoprotein 3, mitochondrial n=1 Tax=Romanomermis culicivorax TaxID=13658 RepID=A0A915HZH4_ROMCU